MKKYIQIQSTFENREDAALMATALLDARLVACCRINEIECFYDWKGERCEGKEFLLTTNTKADLYEECEKFIKARHPYETPLIVAVKVKYGNKEYEAWIDGNVK